MKCVFDGQLKSQDTVLMNLYKRVFCKWSYDPRVPAPAHAADIREDMEVKNENQAFQIFD